MARKQFNAADDAPAPVEETKARFACAANDCAMPGTIFPASAREGVCGWHYGVQGSQWPRVTQVLRDWECVAFEINDGRRALIGPGAADPKFQDRRFYEAVARLRPAVNAGGWGSTFEAQAGEHYENWVKRLEKFLADQVHRGLGGQTQIASTREASHVDQ